MILSWLDHFEHGRFATELLSLKIKSLGGEFNGQGFLWWNAKRGARIKAITDGGEILNQQAFSGEITGLGKLIPSNAYATLDAKTRDGHAIHIERVWPHCYNVKSGHPTAIWNIGQHSILSSISLQRQTKESEGIRTELLLTNADKMVWPKHNPTSLDFETNYGRVTGWKRDSLARIQIIHPKPVDVEAIANSIIIAFRFWAGCIVNPIASEYHNEREQVRRIARIQLPRSTPAIAPPLGHMLWPELNECHEPLLAKCVEYFADDANSDIGILISAYLSSGTMPFSVHLLIAATCVEGLAKQIATDEPVSKSLSREDRIKIEHLHKLGGLRGELIHRFASFMDRMNEPSGSNALAKWCKSGYLGMAQDDFKAFSALRNKAAHGKLDLFGDDDATKQTSLEKSNRLHNMLNKLVFKLVGYEGPYFDYGRMSVANFKVSK